VKDAAIWDPMLSSLVKAGILTLAEAQQALRRQAESGEPPLGEVLIHMRLLPEGALAAFLAVQQGLPMCQHVDILEIAPEVLTLVPGKLIRQNLVVPTVRRLDVLSIVMVYPIGRALLDQIERHSHCRLDCSIGLRSEVLTLIAKHLLTPK
jgi:hypothetical protein